MSRQLRLGTRASPRARAQSALVARALEARHPGLKVELVALETRGDRNLSVPLSAVDDPEF
ncbi:MAG: hydroxymethylbilane synthase, partial [Chromatiales bacterium]|nr:hydroxymethylbilane synthase [Chromatiales bacterium]